MTYHKISPFVTIILAHETILEQKVDNLMTEQQHIPRFVSCSDLFTHRRHSWAITFHSLHIH